MKICVLNSAYDFSNSPFKEFDPEPDPTLYLPEHECILEHIHKATAISQIRDLMKEGFDVFINLCDGAWDEDRAGIEVVETLEKLGAAYTGANAYFYEPSREVMKMVCADRGIATPGYVFATRVDEYLFALENLHFPMIVKHPSSYGSIGLTKNSRVTTADELKERVENMITTYGSALIEEFIEGREYTVLIAEDVDNPNFPMTFAPVEYKFPQGESFKHFDLKWIEFEGMDVSFCEDPVLMERMKEMTRNIFLGLKGRGYGRTDIRVDENGKPWLLEINANPSIFYPEPEFGSADNVLKFDAEGHRGFLRRIIKSALYHQAKRKKKFKIMQNKHSDFGLYATEPIKAGDMVIEGETKAQALVSRSYVNEHWSDIEKKTFEQYAYPITDEVWGMWSDVPEEWKPINHSCDPNTWLTGLNVTARRDIAVGEQLTMDYATFSNEVMAEFECHCGNSNCRGTIKGTDYLEDFMEVYGDHVSDYVKQRRKVAELRIEN